MSYVRGMHHCGFTSLRARNSKLWTALHYSSFVRETTIDRWIYLTICQWCAKRFHVMPSSWLVYIIVACVCLRVVLSLHPVSLHALSSCFLYRPWTGHAPAGPSRRGHPHRPLGGALQPEVPHEVPHSGPTASTRNTARYISLLWSWCCPWWRSSGRTCWGHGETGTGRRFARLWWEWCGRHV